MIYTEIEERLTYYKNLYSTTRKEQEIDDGFYNDRFSVPQILDPVKVMRTGRARRLIDRPASMIITSNPQASRRPIKENSSESEADKRIVNYLNYNILPSLGRSNPNRPKEFVKKQLLRGEGWLQTLHNSAWVTGEMDRSGVPWIFRIVDPLIVYASPEEDENGVPKCVFLCYDRSPDTIKNLYPDWTNPQNTGGKRGKDNVQWWEYWDEYKRVFSADGEYVLKSEDNPYGFVPFVHKVAGFGSESFSGKMEDYIVGRLKFSRDTLTRECAVVSSLDYSIHTFSNRSIDVQPSERNVNIPKDFADKYVIGTGVVHELPWGVTVTRAVELLPEAQVFQYLRDIEVQLELEDPLASSMPLGESGRQQDMTIGHALKKYSSILENTETAFATAMGQALEMLDVIPKLRPDEIKKGDVRKNYEIKVKLQAEDPLENDRKATLGSRLLSQKEIDPITNLVEFKGYTKEQAEDIVVDMMAWDVILTDPGIKAFLAYKGIQKSGMAQELEQFKLEQGVTEPQSEPIGNVTPNTKQRAAGEVKSPTGNEMQFNRGQRTSPTPYNRGA